MASLSINLFSPLWQGAQFVRSLGPDVDDWQHTVRAVGGYWDGTYSETIRRDDLGAYLQDALGQHVVVKDDALDVIWEGFINRLTIRVGGFSWQVGPMLDAINRTFVEYNLRDPVSGKALAGRLIPTEWGDNLDAQARYGIIEKILSVQGANQATAVEQRNSFLATGAWPKTSQSIASGGNAVSVEVECFGYVRWLDRVIYNQTVTTGDVFLAEKIKNVLLTEPNGFFETSGASYTRELIANGNFEIAGGGGADIWASWTETVGDGTLTNVTADHKEGANCCGQTAGATFNTLIYQNVTVVAGQAYRLTFWSKDMSTETAAGNHDGAAGAAFLTDSSEDFLENGILTGQTVGNTPDGSTATISAVTTTQVHGTLTGGTSDDWQVAEAFTIVKGAYPARYQLYDATAAADMIEVATTSQFGNTAWTKTTVTFYAPAGCTSVRIYLMCAGTNAKEVRFDAVSVKEWSAALADHSTLVPSYEDRNRIAWPVIRELLGYGDYLSRQYNWGVYADREVRFEVAPEEIEYLVSISDVGRAYTTPEGGRVEEYNILPGKWLLITGVLVGHEPPSLQRDPRAMFLASVEYNAKTGATLNSGEFGRVKQALARIGLQEL